jgi:hypothetical protein
MREPFRPVTTNLAAVRIEGLAGLPVVALVIVIAIVLPEARWLLASGVVAGAVAGAVMIFVRRRRSANAGGDSPTLIYPGARSSELAPPPSARRGGGLQRVELAALR